VIRLNVVEAPAIVHNTVKIVGRVGMELDAHFSAEGLDQTQTMPGVEDEGDLLRTLLKIQALQKGVCPGNELVVDTVLDLVVQEGVVGREGAHFSGPVFFRGINVTGIQPDLGTGVAQSLPEGFGFDAVRGRQ